MEILIKRLIELREARELTQVEVAKELCVSLEIYRRWEKGMFPRRNYIEYLVRIVNFYDVTLDYLCGVV